MPLERLIALFLLDRLAGDEASQPLASAAFLHDGPAESRERIDRVLTHLHSHYDRPVPLDDWPGSRR